MRFAPPEVAAAIQAVRQRQIESIAATPPRSRRRVALQDRLVLTTAQLLACEPPVKLTPREVIAQEIAMRRSKR
jgi:hypothetical protein